MPEHFENSYRFSTYGCGYAKVEGHAQTQANPHDKILGLLTPDHGFRG